MKSLIKRLFVAATMLGLLGSVVPAFAQTSGSGVNPTLITGDQSATRIASVCGIEIRGSLQLSPPTQPPPPGDFDVDVIVGTNGLQFTDTSLVDQQNGTPTVEAVGLRRNGTNVYCYANGAVHDAGLVPGGGGTPNQVTFIWAPGPCRLEDADVAAVCDIYNTPEATVDFIQGHLINRDQPINLCGCVSDVVFCDPTLPPETAGACIPQGQTNEFQGSDAQNAATVGAGTCKLVALPSSGGTLSYTTICK